MIHQSYIVRKGEIYSTLGKSYIIM